MSTNMVTRGQRLQYVSDTEDNTSSEVESNNEMGYNDSKVDQQDNYRRFGKNRITRNNPELNPGILTSNNGRKAKCFSRNALLARENRLKKKLYVSTLETEVNTFKERNKRLSKVVESQSLLITDLKKEVKYLKSILANSSDISNLIKNINHSTGMSVKSSLDSKLSLNNCISKQKFPNISRKTAHPWEEADSTVNKNFTEPDSLEMMPPELEMSEDLNSILMNDPCLGILDYDFFDRENNSLENNDSQSELRFNHEIPMEHNYTFSSKEPDSEDVGVCLHVSKHRVSLEFCSQCSDRAKENWNH